VLIYMLGHGIHQPCGQAGAVGPFPQAAGAASALSGFLMMVFAFAMGQWLGANMDDSVLPLTNGLWFWGVVTAAVAWGLVGRTQREA
jgi:DHA1 family bicyclomycin/chloramphenicol resistance-like MFS transporter